MGESKDEVNITVDNVIFIYLRKKMFSSLKKYFPQSDKVAFTFYQQNKRKWETTYLFENFHPTKYNTKI